MLASKFSEFYNEETERKKLSSLNLYKFESGEYIKDTVTESHYMTITELIEYSDDVSVLINKKTILKVASWGNIYYIDFDEYKNQIDLFTNILSINKT